MSAKLTGHSKKLKKNKKKLIKIVLILIGIIILADLFYFISGVVKQERLENKFALLETDIDQLEDQFQNKFPEKIFKKVKYCQNYSWELTKGPLHCDVRLESDSNFSVEESNAITSIITNDNNWTQKSAPETKSQPFTSGAYIDKKTDFTCTLNFSNNFKNKKKFFNFYLWCQELSDNSFYSYRSD